MKNSEVLLTGKKERHFTYELQIDNIIVKMQEPQTFPDMSLTEIENMLHVHMRRAISTIRRHKQKQVSVAQEVEHPAVNRKVGSSSLPRDANSGDE